MTYEQSRPRHARGTRPLGRLLAVIVTASALVGGVVAVGSLLNDRDRGDDMVTLVPTSDPTPRGEPDESPPPEDVAGADPTAASTTAPKPESEESPDAGSTGDPDPGTEGRAPGSPDRSSPDDNRTSPEPGPSPRATYPRPSQSPSPSDPEPTTEPSAPPSDEPEPEPSDTSEPEPPPQDPEPEPEPEPACVAVASVEDSGGRLLFGTWFTAEVTFRNDSAAAMMGWTSTFTITDDFRISKASNAEVVEEAGEKAQVRGVGDTSVRPGESVTFTITAEGWGDPKNPASIAVNGIACD